MSTTVDAKLVGLELSVVLGPEDRCPDGPLTPAALRQWGQTLQAQIEEAARVAEGLIRAGGELVDCHLDVTDQEALYVLTFDLPVTARTAQGAREAVAALGLEPGRFRVFDLGQRPRMAEEALGAEDVTSDSEEEEVESVVVAGQ